ncbi:VPLPA-CTERM sorting domain-containing protein [Arenibacterium sp. CAU 1754]
MFKSLMAASAIFVATAGAGQASTVYNLFDLTGSDGQSSSHAFSSAGVNLTVSGYNHTNGVLGDQITVGNWFKGLSATSVNDDTHLVDGSGPDEMLLFSFDREVTVEAIWFSYYDEGDDFDLATYTGTGLDTLLSDISISATYSSDGVFDGTKQDSGRAILTAGQKFLSDVFGIGADHSSDNFKIKKIMVSYDDSISPVPLPAGGLLLVGGLAGLAALRRKKRS